MKYEKMLRNWNTCMLIMESHCNVTIFGLSHLFILIDSNLLFVD